MEQACSSETLVDFQRTIQRYIPEDRTLQKNRYITQGSINYIDYTGSNEMGRYL
jgi:hypothetical protein